MELIRSPGLDCLVEWSSYRKGRWFIQHFNTIDCLGIANITDGCRLGCPSRWCWWIIRWVLVIMFYYLMIFLHMHTVRQRFISWRRVTFYLISCTYTNARDVINNKLSTIVTGCCMLHTENTRWLRLFSSFDLYWRVSHVLLTVYLTSQDEIARHMFVLLPSPNAWHYFQHPKQADFQHLNFKKEKITLTLNMINHLTYLKST